VAESDVAADEGVTMSPMTTSLAALRVAAAGGGPALVPAPYGRELARALEISVRVMVAANERMERAADVVDVAEHQRASLAFDAASLRYDDLIACAEDAGYLLGLAVVPDRPEKFARPTPSRWTRLARLVAHPRFAPLRKRAV
jgi:hypothetical protein